MAKKLRPNYDTVTALKLRIRDLEAKAAKLPVPSQRRLLQQIRKLKNQVEKERWLNSAAPNGL